MERNLLVSIITPSYNRAYCLETLANSLFSQNLINFEWIIVDDGSTDATAELVRHLRDKADFSLRYFWKSNGGKHTAVNFGLKHARGTLTFIVDSDDKLPRDAMRCIGDMSQRVLNDPALGGLCGLKAYFDGTIVGTGLGSHESLIATPIEIRQKYNVTGDLAEVFKTDILKQFPFPEYANEKFCPEALIWNRLGVNYPLLYFNQVIYQCEYLPDGLTKSITKARRKSPRGTSEYYAELFEKSLTFSHKTKALINFYRFKNANSLGQVNTSLPFKIAAAAAGKVFRFKDSFNTKR